MSAVEFFDLGPLKFGWGGTAELAILLPHDPDALVENIWLSTKPSPSEGLVVDEVAFGDRRVLLRERLDRLCWFNLWARILVELGEPGETVFVAAGSRISIRLRNQSAGPVTVRGVLALRFTFPEQERP